MSKHLTTDAEGNEHSTEVLKQKRYNVTSFNNGTVMKIEAVFLTTVALGLGYLASPKDSTMIDSMIFAMIDTAASFNAYQFFFDTFAPLETIKVNEINGIDIFEIY